MGAFLIWKRGMFMKAILVNGDRSLRWDEVPDPVLGEDDCLIQVEAAALNRADLMQREGDYPPPPGSPEWMGLEISGTVIGMSPGARRKSKFQIGESGLARFWAAAGMPSMRPCAVIC